MEFSHKVDERRGGVALEFVSMFQDLTEDKYLVDAATAWAEDSLVGPSACMSGCNEAIQHKPGEDLWNHF